MAAGAFTFYNGGKQAVWENNMEGVTVEAVLLTSAYTPAATHAAYSDVSANECADGDYASKTLTSVAVTEASGTVKWDAEDVTFGNPVTITAKYIALIIKAGAGLVAGDKLIGYMDLNTAGSAESVASSASEFIVRWATAGIATS